MHPYLIDTEYAVRGHFGLIGDEDTRLAALRSEIAVQENARSRATAMLYAGAPPTAFGEDTTPYFEKRARAAKAQAERAKEGVVALEATLSAKVFSVRTLAGSILQIAKQGIVVAHGSLSKCPPGRQIGSEPLKDVIWAARNQAMHWEENNFNPAVVACFNSLAASFGVQFQLPRASPENLAKDVIDLLQWNSYDAYANDMQALLPECAAQKGSQPN